MKFILKPFSFIHRTGRHHINRRPYLLPIMGLFLGAAIVELVAFYDGDSKAFRPSESHVVYVFDSGKKRTVDTKADTVGDLVKRLNLNLIPQDVVEPSLDTPIVEDN